MVTHTATINPNARIRFYYHQLVNKNLQLLCPVCDKNKVNLQQRAYGLFRRFIFGKHLVSWLKINTAAKAALERRMLGLRDKEFNFKKKKDLEIISCSVHACGHKKAFNWLAAQTRKRQLWFICEDCWPKYKSTHLKLALLFELCTNVRTYRANEEPVELQQFDYANN
jgi:hypothetical protein